jgi:predicted DNA-binding protein YlxM (UPF0122 family)
MAEDLSNKIIYNDFVSKTFLTDDEKQILDMYILKESIIKISQTVNMSERSVSRNIKTLKEKYNKYKQLQITMINLLMS